MANKLLLSSFLSLMVAFALSDKAVSARARAETDSRFEKLAKQF